MSEKSQEGVISLHLRIDLNFYSRSVLQKTVMPFTKNCFVEIRSSGETEAEVVFTSKQGPEDWNKLRGMFLNELLDQTLREQVARETESVRNLILAHALSKMDLIGSEASHASEGQ